MAAHAHRSTNLDLPSPWRAAAPLLVLAAVGLMLLIDPRLPWAAGIAAAVCFVAAAGVRTVRAERELAAVRRTADRLIIYEPHNTRDASELVRWREAELTSREHRRRLRREVELTLRRLDRGRLPSASPLRRAAARRHEELLNALAVRVGSGPPVAARGVLLAEQLLREPSSPLYDEEAEPSLARALTRVLGALEP